MFVERVDRLKELRRDLGLSQAQMADKMGLPLRTYEDIEAERSKIRPVHMRAAIMAGLLVAEANNDAQFIPHEARDMIRRLGKLVD